MMSNEQIATPGAIFTGEDSVTLSAESSRPRELLAAEARFNSIGQLLSTPGPTVGENNVAFHWRRDCDWLHGELGDARELLEQAAPHLRTLASNCQACGGSGEIVFGQDDESAQSEPCKHCKPLWDLIERMGPGPAPPPPLAPREVCDENPSCTLDKGHTGDCDDDIPF